MLARTHVLVSPLRSSACSQTFHALPMAHVGPFRPCHCQAEGSRAMMAQILTSSTRVLNPFVCLLRSHQRALHNMLQPNK